MNNEELIDALSECRKAVRECLSTPESCAKLASLKAALEARRNEAQEVIDELEKKESKTDDLINELERSNDLLTAQILEFKKTEAAVNETARTVANIQHLLEVEEEKDRRLNNAIRRAQETLEYTEGEFQHAQAQWKKYCDKKVVKRKAATKHKKTTKPRPPVNPPTAPGPPPTIEIVVNSKSKPRIEYGVLSNAADCDALKRQYAMLYLEPGPDSVFYSIAKTYKRMVGEAIPPEGDRLLDIERYFLPARAVGIYRREQDALAFQDYLKQNAAIDTTIWRKNGKGKYFVLVAMPPLSQLIGEAQLTENIEDFFSYNNTIGIYTERSDAEYLRDLLLRHPDPKNTVIERMGYYYHLIMM